MTDIEKLAEKAKLWPATNGEGDGLSSAYVGDLLTDLAAALCSEHEARVKAERERDAKLPNGADLAVIRQAYQWSLTIDGDVWGLVSGDMGYEETGIKIDPEHLEASKCAVAAAEARALAAERERDEARDNVTFWKGTSADFAALADTVRNQRDEAVRLLREMANAADDVGVVHLDTDDPTRETEELMRATHAARAFLSTLPPAPPAPEQRLRS